MNPGLSVLENLSDSVKALNQLHLLLFKPLLHQRTLSILAYSAMLVCTWCKCTVPASTAYYAWLMGAVCYVALNSTMASILFAHSRHVLLRCRPHLKSVSHSVHTKQVPFSNALDQLEKDMAAKSPAATMGPASAHVPAPANSPGLANGPGLATGPALANSPGVSSTPNAAAASLSAQSQPQLSQVSPPIACSGQRVILHSPGISGQHVLVCCWLGKQDVHEGIWW